MTLSYVSQVALWITVIVNLVLTLRLVSWLRGRQDWEKYVETMESIPELEIDSEAPEFSAMTLTGRSVSLKDFRGKATVFFFFSPDCPYCRKEAPDIVKLNRTVKENVRFVFVSILRSAPTLAWKQSLLEDEKVDIDGIILIAPIGLSDLFMKYNARSVTPYFCFIDEDGIIKARGPVSTTNQEWFKLKSRWQGIVPLSNPRQLAAGYR